MDISKLTVEAKQDFIRTGRGHPTDKVLAQVALVRAGWADHGAKLKLDGFTQRDFDAMEAQAAAQQTLFDERADSQRDKRLARRSDRDIVREGKAARRDAAQVARSVAGALAPVAADPAQIKALGALSIAADGTSGSASNVSKLRDQLRALDAALAAPELGEEVEERGGVEVRAAIARLLPELDAAIEALAQPRHDASLTEQLDLGDGILIHYARAARRAARAASRRHGQPALADAFALTHL